MNALRRRRPLRTLLILVLAIVPAAVPALPVSPVPLADAKREEAPETLLALDMDGGDAEVFIGGSWKGSLIGTGGFTFGSSGAALSESESPLLFAQEIDLTLSAVILGHWFVEANFLDDYDLNTYRAGYMGAEGDTIRYVGIGNVGLDFPDFPYADIAGGTPSSFGAYGAFGSGPLGLHAMVRYDSATREEKVYVGTRERTQTDVAPGKRLKGRAFVLPDQGLDAAPVVYLEDADKGALTGDDGRKYRTAEASEAAVSATLGLVELSETASGRVAVAYSKSGSDTPWTTSMGDYSLGTGFLGETQAAFDSSGQELDLSAYPQPGGGSGAPADISIAGTNALVVYDPGAFSPFEQANRYAPPSGSASDSSASLVYASSGGAVGGFELEESTSATFSISTDADGETTVSTTGRYFVLISTLSAIDKRAPETRFPLAGIEPSAYLPGVKGAATDVSLRFTSYGSSGSYDIGTDVVAGSVVVTRGGVRDPLASYDTSTGTVSLSSAALSGEIIRISYLKNSQDRRFGSIAAGLGAVYDADGGFSARAALALRWNVAPDAFTTGSESSPGTIALSGSAAWKRGDFKANAAAALAFEAPDTTGLYRAAGMEGSEFDLGLDIDAAEAAYPPEAPNSPDTDSEDLFSGYWSFATKPLPENSSPLVYRDYTASDILGNTTLKPITWTGASADSSQTGPYPVSVTELGGKTAYVAEYELGTDKAEDGGFALWAGFQMTLGSEAESLERARMIVLPYRFYDIAGTNPVRAYVQIGSLADADGDAESAELVWSAPLKETDYAINADRGTVNDVAGSETDWESPAFDLSDLDRARLAGARAIRVVVRLDDGSDLETTEPTGTVAASGKLLVLPPVVQGADFRPIVVSGGNVSVSGDEVEAAESVDSSLASAFSSEITRLHPDGESQRVLAVSWTGLDSTIEAIGADGYPSPLPLWSYRTLSFFLKGPTPDSGTFDDGAMLRVVVAASSAALSGDGASARFIDAEIPVSAFTPGQWSKVSISYGDADRTVAVDGGKASGASVVYRSALVREYRNASSAYGEREGPRYFALALEAPAGLAIPDGSLALDEISLEDPIAGFGAYSGGSLAWKRNGPFLSVGSKAVLSDLALEARSEFSAFGNPFGDAANAQDGSSAKGGGSVSANVLGASVSAAMSAGLSSGELSWAGSHRADLPLGVLGVGERFEMDADAATLDRTDSLRIIGPLAAEASAAVAATETKTTRTWKASLKAGTAKAASGPALGAEAGATAAYTSSAESALIDGPYDAAWLESSRLLLPDAGADERKRTLGANAALSFSATPIGLSAAASGSSLFNATLADRTRSADLRLNLPLKLGGASAALALYRSMRFTEDTGDAPGDAQEDIASFGRAMSGAEKLWTVLPLSSLGDSSLPAYFSAASASSSAAGFTDGFENAFTFPRAFGAVSFFLPTAASFSLERKLERELETDTDSVSASASLQFSSINVFGAFGSAPLFSFYKSDEFSHAFSFKTTYPKNEDAEWEFGLKQAIAFYGFSSAKFSLVDTTRFGTDGVSHGSAIVWTIPRKNSLLKTLYRFSAKAASGWKNGPLFAELAAAEATAEQRETLEVAVSSADDISWSWKLKHESILNAARKLTMIAFASVGASGGVTDGDADDTTATVSAGLTLSLKF